MLLYKSQWWKWVYSLETILYKKKKTTILNNESILLILIMEIIASTKIWYTRVL